MKEQVGIKRSNDYTDFPHMNVKRNETPITVGQILKKYPGVFDQDMFKEAPKHEARHYIPTRGTTFLWKG